jgi:O-antigen/teichoic acid export membrane protein
MSHNKYLRLVMDIAVFTMGTVLTKVVQFLLMPLYTTYMTTEAYGMAELTNNMSELFFPIVTLCIYEAVFRYTVGSQYKKEQVFSIGIKLVSISALIGAIILIVSNVIKQYHYAWCLYFILYMYSFRMLVAYYIRGKGYTKLFAASGIMNAIFLALFSYLFLVRFQWSVEGYLLAIGISYMASMIFLIIGGNVYSDIIWNIKDKILCRELLKYSTPLIIYNIGYWVTTMSGRYILLWSKGASDAGIYAAVVKLAAVINMFQQAFYAAFQLNTSREYNSTDKEEYFSNIFRLYSATMLVFGSFVVSVSPLLAKFTLKKDFYDARIYLSIILFIAIVDCMFCFYKTMYSTFKLTARAVPSMLLGAFINIVVGIATVEKYGIWGICLATLFCYVSQIIYRIIDVNKFVKIKCNWKYIIFCLTLLLIQAMLLTNINIARIVGSFVIMIVVVLAGIIESRADIMRIGQSLKVLKNKYIEKI